MPLELAKVSLGTAIIIAILIAIILSCISITGCHLQVIDINADTNINDSNGKIAIWVGLNAYKTAIGNNEAGKCMPYTASKYVTLKSWGMSNHHFELSIVALVCGMLSITSLILFEMKKTRYKATWFLHFGVVGLLITTVLQSFLALTIFPTGQEICSRAFLLDVLIEEYSMVSNKSSISCQRGSGAIIFHTSAILWGIAFAMIIYHHDSLNYCVGEQMDPEEGTVTSLESGSNFSSKTGFLRCFPIPSLVEVTADSPISEIIEMDPTFSPKSDVYLISKVISSK